MIRVRRLRIHMEPGEPSRDEILRETAEVLRRGGVVVLPTETVYGLATLWGNPEGRARIYQMKTRPSGKPLQMLAPDLETAFRAGVLPDPVLGRLADAFWPGPLTVVAPAGENAFIGVRIPAHGFVLDLLRVLRSPLAATSANRSGKAPALTASAAVEGLASPPDLVVDAGPIREGGIPSTVIRLRPPDRIDLLREGPVSLEQIRNVLHLNG